MERILTAILTGLLIIQPMALANEQAAAYTEPQKSYTYFTECTKTFPIGFEKLLHLTLAAANEYNYQIKEIQTKSGYIIFETGYRKFLASVIYVSASKSMLKITPYSGNYDFSPEVVKKLFKFIDENINLQY